MKSTNHHILDRAFLNHINTLQTLRLHLECGYGIQDPVYRASRLIRTKAPNFFSSTILGLVHNSFDDDEAAEVRTLETDHGGADELEGFLYALTVG